MNPHLFLGLVSALVGHVGSVAIVRLSVPEVVQANTTAVILDCEYRVDDWEYSGLVVKWYVDGVHLVYQWIPPRLPQALGVLNGRVNTTYEASQDAWAKYRALYIPNPDPSLSGQYSCTVSTFEDEDTRSANLLVWAPARYVDLKYWRPSEHLVNITCFATGAAPRPKFTLYTRDTNGTSHPAAHRKEVPVRGVSARRENGLWWAGAWGLIVWADTEPDTIIGCTVKLPGTPHGETRKKIYHRDLPIITTTTTTTVATTTTKASEPPRRWSNMSQNVPTTTNSFFDFPSLFGAANGEIMTLPAPLCTISLTSVVSAVWWLVAFP
ncbi:uncharacterized protein LOC122246123 isoform X1 [Penaeus japonicus]|uniref:uncharacterized protein LOC122246123 isoform X1 n=1 Tax=Penaeus japonicus TaxID=27405 RepID=UPI001C712919|nr:uncharacterized protein LOC122246123 isoform X1 [Penaeus japonicus]